MTYKNDEILQRLAQQNWKSDLNGALRDASGLDLDENGVCYALFGKEAGASFSELVALLGAELILDGSGDASTPDAPGLGITGDMDIRVLVRLTDWTAVGTQTLLAKYNPTGEQRSYRLQILPTGVLRFQWSTNGTATAALDCSIALPFVDGTEYWVRAVVDVDNGAAGRTARFYSGSADGLTWTQIGTDVTTATATSIFAGTALLEVGGNAGTARAVGAIRKIELRNGIDGSLVANPDFRYVKPGSTSVTDGFGNVFTLAGTAAVGT